MRKYYLALLLSMLWTGMALAETIDGITYTLDNSTSTATVTYTPSGNVVIPATVKYNNRTYKVTEIKNVNMYITSCEIPEGVTSIGTAFQNLSSLTSVSISSTIQRIEGYAFSDCTSLISINIPKGVTYIGDKAFSGCTALPSITIPTTLMGMGSSSFADCTNLKKIIWNAVHCADFASGSKAPFSVRGKDQVNYYTTSITFGEEVEYIPAYLCYAFTDISTLVIPNNVKEIGDYAFSGEYLLYASNINSYYGYKDENLTSITLGTGLEKIGSYAFWGRTKLSSVTIPDKCTTIGSYAFSNCSNLAAITFGKSITTIGTSAFEDCSNINTINIYATTPPVITKDVFNAIPDLMAVTLNVRSKAVDAYKAADVWKEMYVQAMENDIRTFTLNVSSADENKGTTTPGGMYDEDSEILIYAAAKDGYKFSRWNDGNTDNPRTVKMIGDLSYKAYFEAVIPISKYNITASANAVEGTVVGAGIYEAGTQVTLAAVGNTSYHFVQWADGNAANPRQVTVTADASYTAQFAKDAAKYTLTTSSTNAAQGTAYGQGKYEEGTSVAIFAVANDGYHFTQWHDGNIENPRMVTVSNDATYFANFAQEPVAPTLYEVNVKPENTAQGWTTEGGSFELGTQIMLYAHPANGFEFSQWSDGNTENPRFLTITKSVDLNAKFKVKSPNEIGATYSTTTGTPIKKVISNGKVFIEYGDKTYTTQGIEIR